MQAIEVQAHPQLELGTLTLRTPVELGELDSPGWLLELLRPDAESPLRRDEASRAAVRDLLRHGGYKPTGRGKPSSEYLARAAGEGTLSSINPAVDLCNAVSLHSGLPISAVDAARLSALVVTEGIGLLNISRVNSPVVVSPSASVTFTVTG